MNGCNRSTDGTGAAEKASDDDEPDRTGNVLRVRGAHAGGAVLPPGADRHRSAAPDAPPGQLGAPLDGAALGRARRRAGRPHGPVPDRAPEPGGAGVPRADLATV